MDKRADCNDQRVSCNRFGLPVERCPLPLDIQSTVRSCRRSLFFLSADANANAFEIAFVFSLGPIGLLIDRYSRLFDDPQRPSHSRL